MDIEIIISAIAAIPSAVTDIEAAVAKVKSDPTLAVKLSDGVVALQHLVIDLQGILTKL